MIAATHRARMHRVITCDLNTVLALNQVIRSPRVILTHISHQFDAWLMENALPSGFEAGFDGMEIEVA